MHELGLVLIASALSSLITWNLAWRSGHKDAVDKIAANLLRIRRQQEEER
jgi:hypothetical protein